MRDSENHDGDEVIDLNATASTTTDTEDRGDVVTPVATDPAPATGETDAEVATGDHRVPIARFNEVNEQRKEMQRRWEETQRELEAIRASSVGQQPAAAPAPAAPVFDEDAKETEYAEALLDGDTKKAASIRREINVHQQRVAIEQYRELQAVDHTLAALDQVTQQTLQTYPWLNTPEGDEVLEMIVGLRDRKIQGGMPAHQALSQAVAAIAPRFAPDGQPPGKGLPAMQPPVDTRVSRSLARGATDANLQPPAVQAGVGNRSGAGVPDIESMSDEQFKNLPEAERAKLRGD